MRSRELTPWIGEFKKRAGLQVKNMDASLPEVRLRPQPTERERLLPWRYALVGVGALHTLLCAGVVFGWSSLEAVLRAEGRFGPAPDELFAFVFRKLGEFRSV